LRLIRDRRVPVEDLLTRPNPNITVERRTLPELRDLYARSRFVVVPLLPSRSDNGVTVILEAMAMGKAVVCSATAGQVDVIEDGVTGLFVPVGDPAALRAAMVALWRDPERARAIGARARAYVERYHTLERFCSNVTSAVTNAVTGQAAPSGAWWEPSDVALRE
jgi:glycosyltransferase involved in cell wall biosynthesis